MFLSNRDIKWAIKCGKLTVEPSPDELGSGYDETSIDLHLGKIDDARVWDIVAFQAAARGRGVRRRAEIQIGSFEWDTLAGENQVGVPDEDPEDENQPVFRRGSEVVVRPFGFLLWPTLERVGTPRIDPQSREPQRHPELISFVNAKSTKARVGLMVHFTAPTIHAGWTGHITLEITNLGPFDFVLRERDAVAQLTVATISSAPDMDLRVSKQLTLGQVDPSGALPAKPSRKTPRRNR